MTPNRDEAPAQHPVGCPQPSEAAKEGTLVPAVSGRLPVHPGQLVILAVDVVVALLGAAHLVSVRQHGDALRQQERGQQVALLPGAQREHLRIVRLALDPAVPGPVTAVAVLVPFPVRVVVLVVVRDEVAQRESVVGGDQVDRRPGHVARRSTGRPSPPAVREVSPEARPHLARSCAPPRRICAPSSFHSAHNFGNPPTGWTPTW